jgi:hypothetical protein
MTAVLSPSFPPQRALSLWWKQLSALSPQALWFSYLVIHRVEALVTVQESVSLDPLSHFVLRACSLRPPPSLEEIEGRLLVDRPLLFQVLRHLERAGMLMQNAEARWSLRPAGEQALPQGRFVGMQQTRRLFHFLDGEPGKATPQFVQVSQPFAGIALGEEESSTFSIDLLAACLHQPVEWKKLHGFPSDVTEIIRLENNNHTSTPSWKRVILDHVQRVPAILAQVAGRGDERVVAVGVKLDEWSVSRGDPFLTLGPHGRDVLANFMREPDLESWRRAWQMWSRARSLPTAEVDACVVQRRDCRLLVTAPPSLIERLRTTKNEVLKGETLLLAGEGGARSLARIELTPA